MPWIVRHCQRPLSNVVDRRTSVGDCLYNARAFRRITSQVLDYLRYLLAGNIIPAVTSGFIRWGNLNM